MDRGDWWATVHAVTKSQTQLSTHTPETEDLQKERRHLSLSQVTLILDP